MVTLAELSVVANTEPDAFQAIAACYEALLYGVPSAEGFAYLIGNAVATNYGSNDATVEFNRENIFINLANSLVAGNAKASANFQEIIGEATTLTEKIIAICTDIGVSPGRFWLPHQTGSTGVLRSRGNRTGRRRLGWRRDRCNGLAAGDTGPGGCRRR